MPKHAENFITKLEAVRKVIKMRFPSMNMQKLAEKMSRLGHYHYDKKRFFIVGEERELYNFLIENSYNHYTLYRWLLLERALHKATRQYYRRKSKLEMLGWVLGFIHICILIAGILAKLIVIIVIGILILFISAYLIWEGRIAHKFFFRK